MSNFIYMVQNYKSEIIKSHIKIIIIQHILYLTFQLKVITNF